MELLYFIKTILKKTFSFWLSYKMRNVCTHTHTHTTPNKVRKLLSKLNSKLAVKMLIILWCSGYGKLPSHNEVMVNRPYLWFAFSMHRLLNLLPSFLNLPIPFSVTTDYTSKPCCTFSVPKVSFLPFICVLWRCPYLVKLHSIHDTNCILIIVV